MKTATITAAIDELVGKLGECLTPESARVLKLRASAKLQACVDDLASR